MWRDRLLVRQARLSGSLYVNEGVCTVPLNRSLLASAKTRPPYDCENGSAKSPITAKPHSSSGLPRHAAAAWKLAGKVSIRRIRGAPPAHSRRQGAVID